MTDAGITLPAGAVRALFGVYEAVWHKTSTYDPGYELVSDGVKLAGIAGLLSSEDAGIIEEACAQAEPYEALLRKALA